MKKAARTASSARLSSYRQYSDILVGRRSLSRVLIHGYPQKVDTARQAVLCICFNTALCLFAFSRPLALPLSVYTHICICIYMCVGRVCICV